MPEPINRLTATIVVAVARNGVIGLNNELPWKLSSDLQRFKRLTMGHALIMGRKTYESIGRPLPGRTTVVLSRTAKKLQLAHEKKVSQSQLDPQSSNSKLLFCEYFEEALSLLPPEVHPFVVGGSQIYELTLPKINRIWITRVLADVQGDAFMPEWSAEWPLESHQGRWKKTFQEMVPVGPKDDWPSCFEEWTAFEGK